MCVRATHAQSELTVTMQMLHIECVSSFPSSPSWFSVYFVSSQPVGSEYDNEPMFALIQAQDPEKLRRAVHTIEEVIKMAIETPEGENELKRMQLRELAMLNGTLRDDEQFLRCKNCGSSAHRTFQCSERQNFVNQQRCKICGGTGHFEADCKYKPKEVRDKSGDRQTERQTEPDRQR